MKRILWSVVAAVLVGLAVFFSVKKPEEALKPIPGAVETRQISQDATGCTACLEEQRKKFEKNSDPTKTRIGELRVSLVRNEIAYRTAAEGTFKKQLEAKLEADRKEFERAQEEIETLETSIKENCSKVCLADGNGPGGLNPMVKQPEGREALQRAMLNLAEQQRIFHSLFKEYNSDIQAVAAPGLGKNLTYDYGFVRPGGSKGKDAHVFQPQRHTLSKLMESGKGSRARSLPKWESVASLCKDCIVSQDGFKILGFANLDDDPELDVWTLGHDSGLTQIQDDLGPKKN